jgi:ribosomal protein S18 acetylase RimI-like enzyme
MDARWASFNDTTTRRVASVRAEFDGSRFSFNEVPSTDPAIDYCLMLAMANMGMYLRARGQNFDGSGWRTNAPRARFFLIADSAIQGMAQIGFLAVRQEPDSPNGLHIGDVQIEPRAQNRGAGSAAIAFAESQALSQGRTELTLNVFRDNPAISLYERKGFVTIDRGFDKFKMRKVLHGVD